MATWVVIHYLEGRQSRTEIEAERIDPAPDRIFLLGQDDRIVAVVVTEPGLVIVRKDVTSEASKSAYEA